MVNRHEVALKAWKTMRANNIIKIIKKYEHDKLGGYVQGYSMEDIERRYVLPMLEVLNWDMNKVNQNLFVRTSKRKGVEGGIQPDIRYYDKANKLICIEVQRPSTENLDKERKEKYDKDTVRIFGTRIVFYTSFENSQLYVFSKDGKHFLHEGDPRPHRMTYEEYYSKFNTLWNWLSDSEDGIRTRAALKANAERPWCWL